MNRQSAAKKKEIPHIFVILLAMIVIATIATWLVPAGSYQRVLDAASGRQIIDPASFQYVDRSPVGLFDMFLCIEEGLIEAANITFMIFASFSSLFLLEKTGAIDAAIALLVNKTRKRPQYANLFIVLVMIGLSIWGSTGTMSYEEIIAFIPIFVAISLSLGYDPIVGIAISVVPVGVGFASATVNPFTIGVAQTIAELPLFSGLGYRVLILAVMTAVLILYVMAYAARIKKDPTKSLTYGMELGELTMDETRLNTPMTTPRILSLICLLIAVVVMGWGLITQGWYINQVAAIFIMLAIAVGVINRWSANKIASVYVEGLGKGVLSAGALALCLHWWTTLIALAVFFLILTTTHYMSLASMVAVTLWCIGAICVLWGRWFMVISLACIAIMIIFLHRSNIARLLHGTENKTYLRTPKS